jgi:hypothetical protein
MKGAWAEEKWVELSHAGITTLAMQVPGGCLIGVKESMVFVPNCAPARNPDDDTVYLAPACSFDEGGAPRHRPLDPDFYMPNDTKPDVKP